MILPKKYVGNETKVCGGSSPIWAIFFLWQVSHSFKKIVWLQLTSPGFPVHPLHESGLQAPKINIFLPLPLRSLICSYFALFLQTAELIGLPIERGALQESFKILCPSSVWQFEGTFPFCCSKAPSLEAATHSAPPSPARPFAIGDITKRQFLMNK